MTWWQIAIGVLAVLIAWQVIAYFAGNPKFWRPVGRNPDLALTLFAIERGCVIDGSPPADRKRDYTGPFRLLTSDGVTHKVYIIADDLDAIQSRVAQPLHAAEGRYVPLGG